MEKYKIKNTSKMLEPHYEGLYLRSSTYNYEYKLYVSL